MVDTASQRHGGQAGRDPSERAALLIRLRRRIGAIEGRPITFETGTFKTGTFERFPLEHGVPEDKGGNQAGPAAPAGSGEGPAGGGSARRAPHQSPARWTLGAADIDSRLPGGGLAADTLHEVVAVAHQDGPAAAGFATALMARRLAAHRLAAMTISHPHAGGGGDVGTVLWCAAPGDFGAPYGPGVMHLGLDPGRLLLAHARHDRDVLWAMEEGVRSAALAAVVGEVAAADLTHTRRLALAAAETGVPALLIRHPTARRPALMPTAARTRWQVAASPSPPGPFDARAPGAACWRLELVRCRGGRPRGWTVVWDHEAHRFIVAGDVGHRSAAAVPDTPNVGRFGGIMPVQRAG